MKRLTVALLAAAISTPILAAEKPYVGIDYQLGTYEISGTEVNPEAIRLRAGSELHEYFGVEAQAGFSTASDTLTKIGVKYDIKVDSFYSIFLRPQLKIGNAITAYGLLGGTYIDVSSSSSNKLLFPDDSGFKHTTSYGAGVNFLVKDGIRIGADYVQYLDEYSTINVGISVPIK